jgi:hypothetical protein
MKLLLECSALILPALIFKLWRDRNGTSHPDADGVFKVAFIMILSVSAVRFYEIWSHGAPFVTTASRILWWYLKAFLVAITGYGLLFQPLINLVRVLRWDKGLEKTLGGKGHTDYKKLIIYCLDHLSPTAWPDKWKLRLCIYLVLFIGSVIWFAA